MAAQSASIQFRNGVFRVIGWHAPISVPTGGWQSVFKVYAGSGDVPPLTGTYAVEGGDLVFHPQFPSAPGVHYHAIFTLSPDKTPLTADFDGPPVAKTATTRVIHIYPSSSILPSNQLRLYIYFSAPMSRGESRRYLHILDENGKALDGHNAVLLQGEELWDPRFTRLTMTFDPGRIKRGLTSNMTIGPPIAEGKRYTIVVDKDWPDANGVPLVATYRKEYRGGPALRIPPDPKHWRITSPKMGTREPLVVAFPTPMNYTLLQRMLQVKSTVGQVAGTISTARDEAEWRFTPNGPWRSGGYTLVVETGLEDLAGNHIGQPFDVDTFDRVTETITTQTISLPFSIH